MSLFFWAEQNIQEIGFCYGFSDSRQLATREPETSERIRNPWQKIFTGTWFALF
jgi:hypothetical protein